MSAHRPRLADDPIPARAGIGLRAPHYRQIIDQRPDIGWLEVHPENYMGAGGPPHRYLTAARERYPLSLHGVGLSLGSADPLDREHLAALRGLIERYAPALVSEHLSWSRIAGVVLNDLLPVPYTEAALALFCDHVDQAQEALGRQILVENPSTYLQYADGDMDEAEFLLAVARRTGCGILLDVNNVYVSACNHGFDAGTYLRAIPPALIGEIHLAGHTVKAFPEATVRIDDHGSCVAEAVWALYRGVIERAGPVPTLIEWDSAIPELPVLLGEAQKAEAILQRKEGRQHASAA
jgi:hypothetical protein